jgi:hypothetical protein
MLCWIALGDETDPFATLLDWTNRGARVDVVVSTPRPRVRLRRAGPRGETATAECELDPQAGYLVRCVKYFRPDGALAATRAVSQFQTLGAGVFLPSVVESSDESGAPAGAWSIHGAVNVEVPDEALTLAFPAGLEVFDQSDPERPVWHLWGADGAPARTARQRADLRTGGGRGPVLRTGSTDASTWLYALAAVAGVAAACVWVVRLRRTTA